MPYAQVDGRRLFYARTRSTTANAPTLLLIHGAGGSHLHWPAELRRLPDATVYNIDLPGHGRSDGPGCNAIPDYVAATIGFLNATGIARVVLLGHSMGGAISLMTALNHPERVIGLVLIGTGAKLRVASAILDGILTDFESAVDTITYWLWAEGAPAQLVNRGRQATAGISPQVLYDDYVACDSFDVMGRLGEIVAPTLVVAGAADRLAPHEYGVYLAEHIPNARLVTVDGGGHMMVLEQPGVVAKATAEFIEKSL